MYNMVQADPVCVTWFRLTLSGCQEILLTIVTEKLSFNRNSYRYKYIIIITFSSLYYFFAILFSISLPPLSFLLPPATSPFSSSPSVSISSFSFLFLLSSYPFPTVPLHHLLSFLLPSVFSLPFLVPLPLFLYL